MVKKGIRCENELLKPVKVVFYTKNGLGTQKLNEDLKNVFYFIYKSADYDGSDCLVSESNQSAKTHHI